MLRTRRDWRFRLRGLFGAILLFPMGFLALLSKPSVPGGTWLDLVADVIGWILFLNAAVLRMWSTLYLVGRKEKVVVSEGPYSVCRNPLYLGSFSLMLSVGFLLKSLTFALGILCAAMVYTLVTVPSEERTLREKLGDDFSRYCERVPRFWPRPGLFHTPEVIEVRIKGVWNECRRVLLWILIPVFAAIVARLRHEPWWPNLVWLP